MMKKYILPIIVAAFAYWSISTINWLNIQKHVFNHAPGPCHKFSNIVNGSEDIQVLKNGLAFISSGFHLKGASFNSRVGRIYLFDFNQPSVEPYELPIVDHTDSSFRLSSPHGISLWTDPSSGNVYLYVISHYPSESVDKFQFDASSRVLRHLRRFANYVNFHMLNDLAVVEEDKFYFTNFHYCCPTFEMILRIRWGSVGFYDGKKSELLVRGLSVPNGIALSSDGRSLYVSHIGNEELLVYRRHDDNSLSYSHAIKVWTKLDNLDVNVDTGDVWIGAHPVGYKLLQYLEHPEHYQSPSQVLRVRITPESQQQKQGQIIEELYSDDGSQFSGSSVAVAYGNAMLVGSIASDLLYCEGH